MKEYDCVELLVEKQAYAKEGVHKGMQGWICLDDCSQGYWLVNFPRYGDRADIATISIHQNDMRVIEKMDARINEHIQANTRNN